SSESTASVGSISSAIRPSSAHAAALQGTPASLNIAVSSFRVPSSSSTISTRRTDGVKRVVPVPPPCFISLVPSRFISRGPPLLLVQNSSGFFFYHQRPIRPL